MSQIDIIYFNNFYDHKKIYAHWKGKYTAGDISCRGTRVWFTQKGATFFCYYFEENDDNYKKKFYQELNSKEIGVIEDDCLLRDEHLENIILDIENENENTKQQTRKLFENSKSAYTYLDADIGGEWELKNFLRTTKTKDPILIDLCPTETVWIMHKKQEIIDELQEVLKKCKINKVTFEWI